MSKNDLARFENEMYHQEKEDFLSDKCPTCMGYLNPDEGKCKDVCCPVGSKN